MAANRQQATVSGGWIWGLAIFIALLNAIGWGIYGLVELVGKVVG